MLLSQTNLGTGNGTHNQALRLKQLAKAHLKREAAARITRSLSHVFEDCYYSPKHPFD
jgi:hypothetical protein